MGNVGNQEQHEQYFRNSKLSAGSWASKWDPKKTLGTACGKELATLYSALGSHIGFGVLGTDLLFQRQWLVF